MEEKMLERKVTKEIKEKRKRLKEEK